MTAIVVFLAAVVLVDVLVGISTVRRNRPAFPPARAPVAPVQRLRLTWAGRGWLPQSGTTRTVRACPAVSLR
jgi:hypothetical protein